MDQAGATAEVARQLGGRERASGLTCPKCLGGDSKERSMTAWRDGLRIVATCHRNKCGARFRWGPQELDQAGALLPSVLSHLDRPMAPPSLPITEHVLDALEARYGLHPDKLHGYGCRQIAAGAGLYAPVRGPRGETRGCVVRRLDKALPKVRSYPAADYPGDAPWQAWFYRPQFSKPGPTVVVEDVLSAMRLGQAGVAAVSLLGTSLSEAKAMELRRWAPLVVVALDADAISRAIFHAMRHSFHVRRLEHDVKDMTEEQLRQWIISLPSSLPASTLGMPAR